MMERGSIKWVVTFLALMALSAGCAAPTQPPAAPPAPTPGATPVAAATATPLAQATPTPRKIEKVVLAIPAIGFSDLFTVVAQRKGFYQEEGLEVEKPVMKSDVAVKALMAGELEYSRAIGSALRAAAQGAAVKGILAAQVRPPQLLVARPPIKSVAELKGKTATIDSVGGTTHVLLKVILKHYGLDPEKDVAALALADNPSRLKALQGGAVQGAMLDLAFAIQAETQGMNILANAADITERIMGGLATSDKRIKENPDQVLRMVRASVKALKYMKDPKNKDEIVNIMAQELQISREEALKTYQMGIGGWSDDGMVSEEAVKVEIEEARAGGGITQEVPVSQVFDFSFVRRLKQ